MRCDGNVAEIQTVTVPAHSGLWGNAAHRLQQLTRVLADDTVGQDSAFPVMVGIVSRLSPTSSRRVFGNAALFSSLFHSGASVGSSACRDSPGSPRDDPTGRSEDQVVLINFAIPLTPNQQSSIRSII